MAVTNAISAIVIVGAMLAAALTETTLGKTMGVLAVALARSTSSAASSSRGACWRCSRRKRRRPPPRRAKQ
jgi:NAD(P) transhydrogenase subunit alpha